MKSFNQNILLKGKPASRNIELDSALGYSRGDPLNNKDYPPKEEKGRYHVIASLEKNVSRLQIARHNLSRGSGWLFEMSNFLKTIWDQSDEKEIPASVVNNYLKERLAQIRMTAEAASFQSRALLNGKSGILADTTGKGLYFVKGSARVLSSKQQGYPVKIIRPAKAASLIGLDPLDERTIRSESLIAIKEGGSELRYKVSENETADSLIENLKIMLAERGMEISVDKTDDNRLLLIHQRLGSKPKFQGLSFKTRLLSKIPQQPLDSLNGVDIKGSIGNERAEGNGGFLLGERGNQATDGLMVYFGGNTVIEGQIVGYVKVKQMGVKVPLDVREDTAEILSIPSILPKNIAIAVPNLSGFMSLDEISANHLIERIDALKLIQWAMKELKELKDELKWKEDFYVDLAVKLLRNGPEATIDRDEALILSKEKADEMLNQLKSLVNISKKVI